MFQIIRHDTNYPFTRLMKPALFLSAALILLSIGTVIARGGLNYGIDFVGGTIVEVKFQAPVDIAAVRAALGPAGLRRRRDQALRQPERGARLDRAELDERRGDREGRSAAASTAAGAGSTPCSASRWSARRSAPTCAARRSGR